MKKSVLLAAVACALFASCSQNDHRSRPSSQQENSADWAITTKVKTSIMSDSAISASAKFVSVSTNNGVVTLTGNVKNRDDKDRIVRLTKAVRGVVSVDDQMTVSDN